MALDPILDPNDKTPGAFIKVSLGVGPRVPEGARKILLYGNKGAGGSATVATPYEVLSEDDAADLFERGSELYWEVKAAFAANPSATVWAIAIAESAGSAADETWTFAGTSTAAGTAKFKYFGKELRVAIPSGQTHIQAAAAVETGIEDDAELPFTVTVDGAGAVTVAYKHPGPRGNLVYADLVLEGASGLSVTRTGGTKYLSGGVTLDDGQAALDAVAPSRYHYHVSPNVDATELAKWVTHVLANAQPETGRREVVVAGHNGSKTDVETLATGRNEPRLQVVAQRGSRATPGMIAAAHAAMRQRRETSDAAFNLIGEVLAGLPGPYAESEHWTAAEIKSLLNNGVTPLAVQSNGTVYSVRSITSKSQDGSGAADYRVLDSHKVQVPDFVADDIAVGFPAEFPNSKQAPNPPEGEAPKEGTTTPLMVKDWIYSRLKEHEDDGLIVDVDQYLDQLVVEIAPSPAGRFLASIPLDVIEWVAQLDADVRQIG